MQIHVNLNQFQKEVSLINFVLQYEDYYIEQNLNYWCLQYQSFHQAIIPLPHQLLI